MKVVCISGKAQHGKDTTANMLKEYLEAHSQRVIIAHFGDLVKYVCATFFDWNGQKDEYGRSLLQYVGTDVVRSQQPNYWVDFITSILSLFGDNWDYVLLPDCRFPNEYECFLNKELIAVLVRVNRSNFESPLSVEQQQHPSEIAMDGYHANYYLANDSDLDTFQMDVETLGNKLLTQSGDLI